MKVYVVTFYWANEECSGHSEPLGAFDSRDKAETFILEDFEADKKRELYRRYYGEVDDYHIHELEMGRQ